jgi:hypothetical protein
MQSNRGFALLVAGGFAAGVAIGLVLARGQSTAPAAPIESRVASDAASADAPAATARAGTRPAPRAQPSRPVTTEPLPPADAPVARVFDELAARARAGDAAAARRIADELLRCRHVDDALVTLNLTLDFDAANTRVATAEHTDNLLQMTDAMLQQYREGKERCAGIDALPGSASEWLEQAARDGDPAAMLCYALFPSDWNPNVLSPAWQRHAEQSYAQSPQLLRRAFGAGMPEAAAVLSQMHTRGAGGAWHGRIGDDPYWAYAYALVAADTLPGKRREVWSQRAQKLALPLSSGQRERASEWAVAQRSRMTLPPLPDAGRSRSATDCALLGYLASRL